MTTHSAVLAVPAGLTLTAQLFTMAAPDTVYKTAGSVTYRTNDTGEAVAVFTDVDADDYKVVYFSGARWVARGYRTFTGTDGETATDTPPTAELDSAVIRAALGMSSADLDAQLDAILAAASAGAGTGARTVTITVDDGTTALQNAVVRLNEGVNTFRTMTNASGVAVFNLDDATYTVAVTKSGYTYAGTTLVVDGTETATYSMTAVSVTPPTNPALSAVEVLTLDEDFAAASGIDVDFRMSAVATGDQNRAHPGAKKTVTSNGSGIARFEGPQGATIEWKRGTGQQWTAVTLDNDSVTNVTSLIGSP